MKITVQKLRKLIHESTPRDPEIAALPERLQILHKTGDGTIKKWMGDRDTLNIRLVTLGVPHELRLALMKGQKYANDALISALKKHGAVVPESAPEARRSAELPPGPSGAERAPGGPGRERMSPERVREYLMYYARRFVRNTLKGGPPPADAATAHEIALGFEQTIPVVSRFIDRLGMSREEVQTMIADMLMDGAKAHAEKRSAVDAAPRASKETYKVYPGGARYAGAPVVTRVKGKVYRGPHDSKFKPGEQARVGLDGDKLRVTKTDSDHAQTWEPD